MPKISTLAVAVANNPRISFPAHESAILGSVFFVTSRIKQKNAALMIIFLIKNEDPITVGVVSPMTWSEIFSWFHFYFLI